MRPIQSDIFNPDAGPKPFDLRPYQREAVEKIMWELDTGMEGSSLLVLPTGAGKSIIIAELARLISDKYGADHGILILQPSKELLEQNHAKLCVYINDDEIGIYSASKGRKDTNRFTFATIQSAYKNPEPFKHVKLVLLDECDLLNPRSDEGMLLSFLKAIGDPKVIGLTATPYRQGIGYNAYGSYTTTKLINRVYQKGKGTFWKRIMYNVHIADLMRDGYLCPLEYVDRTVIEQDDLAMNVSRSDFDIESFDRRFAANRGTIIEAVEWAESCSKSVLVFCSSVEEAEAMSKEVPGSEVISGKTHWKERERIIDGFKSGGIKTVFNMGVLTTGFDHPGLDCIVLARPTRSIRLYCQMIGRGVRNAPGKTACKVVDLVGNVKTIGRFETIRVEKLKNWELLSDKGSWHMTDMYASVGRLGDGSAGSMKRRGLEPVCYRCKVALPMPGTACSVGGTH